MRTLPKFLIIAVMAPVWGVVGVSFVQTAPPPDPKMVEDIFAMMNSDKNGEVTLSEVQPWAVEAALPGPRVGPAKLVLLVFQAPQLGPLPAPLFCYPDLMPMSMNALCDMGGGTGLSGTPGAPSGNKRFATTFCNDKGGKYSEIIALSPGRMAGCFRVDAITKNKVVWGINTEDGKAIARSEMGAPPKDLMIWNPGLTTGMATIGKVVKFRLFLDTALSDPGARVTISFVEKPLVEKP